MNKKRVSEIVYEPYSANDDIVVFYELEFNDDVIKPGDKIKLKNERGWYVFLHLAHNVKLDTTWIDTLDQTTGGWKSVRIDKIKLVDRPKRSYRKKIGKK